MHQSVLVSARALSTTFKVSEQGDKVMLETPYVERANLNPMVKYESMQGPLHDYGSWVISALPRFIQQFSVYKDELTFYVVPS